MYKNPDREQNSDLITDRLKRMKKILQTRRSHYAGKLLSLIPSVLALLLLATQPVLAAKTLKDAVKKAGRNGQTKVISARTVEKNNKRTHEVRVLTDKGTVKTMRYPANSTKQNKPKTPRNQTKGKQG